MDNITTQIKVLFNDIKLWIIDLWNTVYGTLAGYMGEDIAKLFLIAMGVALIYFVFFKFVNRD